MIAPLAAIAVESNGVGESGALLTAAAAQRVSATKGATRTPQTFTFIFLTYCNFQDYKAVAR